MIIWVVKRPKKIKIWNNLHLLQGKLAIFKKKKGAYHSGIKIFNSLPTEIKDLSDNSKKI